MNVSGTWPRRQGFVIVTLQAVMALRLRSSNQFVEKNIANQYLRQGLRGTGAGGSVLRGRAPGHLRGYRIERIQGSDLRFSEPGLNELVQAGIAQITPHFTDDTAGAFEASDYLFVCVGTPDAADGSADLQCVMSIAEGIAARMTSRKVVVNKSPVPVGTADKVAECMAAALAARGA